MNGAASTRASLPGQAASSGRRTARLAELVGYQDVAWQPSQVKQQFLGESARWADQVKAAATDGSSVARAAFAVKRNVCWRAFVASTVVFDVAACVVYRTQTAFASGAVGAALRYGVEALISAVIALDLLVRMLAVGHGHRCRPKFIVDCGLLAAMVVCCFCDLLIAWQVPFAAYSLLRQLLRCRHYFDQFVDAAVDRKLMAALGDILCISPHNATARPSDGFFVLEKTHIRTQAFADIHLPVTIKGGFVELVYIDLDIGSRRSRTRPRPGLRESTSHYSPEEDVDGETDSNGQDVETGIGIAAQNVSKVCVELHNLLLVLGPSKSLGKQAWTVEEVCASKERLVQLIAKHTEKFIGGRKKEPQPSKWKPPPTTVLGKLRHHLQRGPIGRLDLSHVSVDIHNVEVRFEDFTLLPKPMSCGFHLANMSMKLDVTHATALRTRFFRAFPGWLHERRLGGEYGGHSVDTDNDGDRPPVRIACCCQPMVAWCDLGTSNREAFKKESFTHLLSADAVEISKLVRMFKRKGAVRKFKLAAVAAMHLADSGDRGYPRHQIQEKILNHRFVLLPLVASFHAMIVDSHTRVLAQEGELGPHPEQVSDLEVSDIAVQLDRDQAANLTALVRLIDDWIKTDQWISRKPPMRLAHAAARFRHRVTQEWWVFAVREIACNIAPGGRLDTFLRARRNAHYCEAYQQLVYERHCAVAARGQRRAVLDPYDKQIRNLQMVLPLRDIVTRRTRAKRQFLTRPKLERWNDDCVRSLRTQWGEEPDGQPGAASSSRGPEEDKKGLFQTRTFTPQTSRPSPPSAKTRRWASEGSEGSRPPSEALSTSSMGKRLSKVKAELKAKLPADLDMHVRRQSGQRTTAQQLFEVHQKHGEPSQVCIRIGTVTLAMLEPPGSTGVREDLVRLRMRGASLIWTRSAPKEHFRQIQCSPARVVDHLDDGAPIPESGAQPAATSMFATAGLTSLLGPSEGLEEHGNGWQTLEVSVSFFSIVYCKAPSDLPSLRKVVVRHTAVGARMAAGGRRAVFHEGYPMVRLRAVFHRDKEDSDEEDPLPSHSQDGALGDRSRAVVVVHCCALRIVYYGPLVDVVLSAISVPPQRWGEDPLLLGDIRRRLEELRSSRNSVQREIRAFEKVTCGKDTAGRDTGCNRRPSLLGHPSSGWRCLAVTAGVRGTSVRQFTTHHFMVLQFWLPPGRQLLQRQALPAYFSLGGEFKQPEGAGAMEWEDTHGSVSSLADLHRKCSARPWTTRIMEGISSFSSLKRSIGPKVEELPEVDRFEQGGHWWCRQEGGSCRCEMDTVKSEPAISNAAPSSQTPSAEELIDRAPKIDEGPSSTLLENDCLQVDVKVLSWPRAVEELELQ